MFSDFPNLHPLVVHFPIVLILLSAALQGLLVFKDSQQLRWGTLIIMGAAFASALVASKIFHAHTTELPPLANEIYQDHERYSVYTLWISGITFLFRGIGEFYRIHRRAYESLVLASALLAAVFLSLTGHRGAQLVYLEGVGPKGNLVMTGEHEHGGSTPESKRPTSAADHGAAGHQGQHGEGSPGQEAKPTGTDGNEMRTMDHSSGHGGNQPMPGMDHGTGNTPAGQGGDRPSHDQMPGMKHPTANGDSHTMPGMNHAASLKPGSGQAKISGMAGMNHPMPAKKTKAMGMENMAGMDHSQMNMATNKSPALDHAAMGHGTTPAPGNQPALSNMPGMSGMDHSTMPAVGQQPAMGNIGGMSGMNAKTDRNGRPLIDPTEPYDNNPAREQAPRRQEK